jgi:hypothetical protein
VSIARLDDHRRTRMPCPPALSAIAKLQDCIDAIASAQVAPTAVVIGLARADAEPIIITAELTSLEAFDEIVDAADQVSLTVRSYPGPGAPTTDELMEAIRTQWERSH